MTFDHELKVQRAFKHLMELDAEIKTWKEGEHYSIRFEYDPDARWTGPVPPGPGEAGSRTNYLGGPVFLSGTGLPRTLPDDTEFGKGLVTAFATAEQPPQDPLSLLIGDSLHNLRSALDVLAFALAKRFTKPMTEEIERSSEFPIFGDEDGKGRMGVGCAKFHQTTRKGDPAPRSGLNKTRGWDPKAQTIVERLQPYQRGNDYRSDPLWMLHDLDRVSKHRLLHTAVTISAGTLWDIPGPKHARQSFRNIHAIGPGLIRTYGGAIETDTPLSRLWGIHLIDPSADVDVKIRPAVEVALGATTPVASGEPVSRTLWGIYIHVAGTVVPALEPFLS